MSSHSRSLFSLRNAACLMLRTTGAQTANQGVSGPCCHEPDAPQRVRHPFSRLFQKNEAEGNGPRSGILRHISVQTILIACFGIADLISTLWLLHVHGAAEANPLMAYFLAYGNTAFILAKTAFLLGPLFILEWARRRNPIFVRRASSAAVLAYVGFYVFGVMSANIAPYFLRPVDNEALRSELWSEIERNIPVKRSAPPPPSAQEGRVTNVV